jgi:hypothetical protein
MNLINENLKYFDNYLDPNILKKMYNKLIDSQCPWHRQVSDNVNSLSFWLCPISNLAICIYPIYNRAIFFNSQIEHRALPCLDKTFRITLAIKTTT